MASEQIAGSRILIVEDEYYVADDLKAQLDQVGVEVLGPVPTTDEARRLIEDGGIDAVLLDVNLRGNMAYDLADELRADRMPFAFVTGYDRSMLPNRFARTPAVPKPLGAERLRTLLSSLVTPGERAVADR